MTKPKRKRRIRIGDEAKRAIADGVLRGDAVAEMEAIGLSTRVIAMLENSAFHIIKLEQLVARSHEELLEIPGLADHCFREVMDCLSRYHQLAESQSEMDDAFAQRLRHTSLPISQNRRTKDD